MPHEPSKRKLVTVHIETSETLCNSLANPPVFAWGLLLIVFHILQVKIETYIALLKFKTLIQIFV